MGLKGLGCIQKLIEIGAGIPFWEVPGHLHTKGWSFWGETAAVDLVTTHTLEVDPSKYQDQLF